MTWSEADRAPALVTFFTGSGLPSGTEGTVPDGVDEVWVCATEPMVDYTLTLTPSAGP